MNSQNKVLVLLLPKTSYRNDAFLEAAKRLNARIIAVQDRCHVLADTWESEALLSLPFDQPAEMAKAIRVAAGDQQVEAVIGVDDAAAVAAQEVARNLSLSQNRPESAQQLTNKHAFRMIQQRLGLPVPAIYAVTADSDKTVFNQECFPLVVKPVSLSASQGVIRVNDPAGLMAALPRIGDIFRKENVSPEKRKIILEQYIPGQEYALEGLMNDGELQVLAVFEKPEPMEGPYFDETLYISPARLPASLVEEFASQVSRVSVEAGWLDGPVHAEARINQNVLYLLEVAPRTIGGRCSRSLTCQLGISLEELVLRHLLDEPVEVTRNNAVVGVCMLPVPYAGIYETVDGVDSALQIPGIEEIMITAVAGESMLPLPEGNQYIGFIIARGDGFGAVESALLRSRSQLDIRLKPLVNLLVNRVSV